MLVLPELAEAVRRDSRQSWRYSSKRQARREQMRVSEGSDGCLTFTTSTSTASSDRSNPVFNELQEKVARMQLHDGPRIDQAEKRHRHHRRCSSSSHKSKRNHHSRSSRSRRHHSRSPNTLSISDRSTRSSDSVRSANRMSTPNHQSQVLSWTPSENHQRRARSRSSSSPNSQDKSRNHYHRRQSSRDSEESFSVAGDFDDSDASLSLDDLVPGAFRVDSIGQISVLTTSSRHHRSLSLGSNTDHAQEEDDDSDIQSVAEQSNSCRSNLRSIYEDEEQPAMVQAVAADDYEDELEQAREQGRREAMNDNSGIPIAVATDDVSQNEDTVADEKRQRRVFCYFALLCCIILVIGSAGTLLLFGGQDNAPLEEEDGKSNLKAVIVYNPPSAEECQAIMNGTMLDGQLTSLLQRSFDIQIDLTLEDASDLGRLLADLLRHIQQKLIPIMAGCQGIELLDATTIAISDQLSNATSSITNGQVQEVSQDSCNHHGPNDGTCRSYVLLLDLYLEEDLSDAVLLEIIGATLQGQEIANALGAMYPVQSASVPMIVPSDALNDGEQVPNVSSAPSSEILIEMSYPSSTPIQDSTSLVPSSIRPRDSIRISPTSLPSKAIQSPSKSPLQSPSISPPSAAPTRMPTLSPTWEPTKKSPVQSPTREPTRNPTASPLTVRPTPSFLIQDRPTVPAATTEPSGDPFPTPNPSPRPTTSTPTSKAPTLTPTVNPTKAPNTSSPTRAPISPSPTRFPTTTPTSIPSKLPTESPSEVPTIRPSKSPTFSPSSLPTDSPSSAQTTMSVPPIFCCSKDFITCGGGGVNPACQLNQVTCELVCSQAAWIQEGTCTTGLARNDDCSNNPSGCCAGTCQRVGVGNISSWKCRV